MLKQGSSVSSEYTMGIVVYLESFTKQKLTDKEVKLWSERLQKYPKYKLDKLTEYAGPLDNRVFSYLDNLFSEQTDTFTSPQEEIGYKQLPDTSNLSKLEKECGIKLLKGLTAIMLDEECKEPKKAISELHAKLRAEYPQFAHSLKC